MLSSGKCFSALPFIFVLALSFSPVTSSQTLPVCDSSSVDPNNDGYGWQNGGSCRVTTASGPAIINRVTGEMVALNRAYWLASDFDTAITCQRFSYDGVSQYSPGGTHIVTLEFGALELYATANGNVAITRTDTTESRSNWRLENGIYSGPSYLSATQWVEVIDINRVGEASVQGVRTWESDSIYHQCFAVDFDRSFIPGGRVLTNPATNVTIPLLNTVGSVDCIDTDPLGDGWGWDGSSSCRVVTSADDNNDNNSVVCTDTDPVGDGWGWNGSASCRVIDKPDSTNVACRDTDPVGDGWGWNGSASCQIPTEHVPAGRCARDLDTGQYTDAGLSCQPEYISYSRSPYVVAKTETPPAIDGIWSSAGEWEADGIVRLSISNIMYKDNYRVQWRSGSAYFAHDGQYLYMLIYHRKPGNYYFDSPTSLLFDDDSWEIYFNGGNESHTNYDRNDVHLIGDWGLTGDVRTLQGSNSQRDLLPEIICGPVANFMGCELKIDLARLGATGPLTREIGFDIHLNGDTDGGDRDFKLNTCSSNYTDTSWFDPSTIRCSIEIRHY